MHLVNGTGNSPSPGQPTPGVVKQDKSSRGSVDTTKTRSDPQRVRMSSGERPIGTPKGQQLNAEALCQPPRNPPCYLQHAPPPMLPQHAPPPSHVTSIMLPPNPTPCYLQHVPCVDCRSTMMGRDLVLPHAWSFVSCLLLCTHRTCPCLLLVAMLLHCNTLPLYPRRFNGPALVSVANAKALQLPLPPNPG